MFESDDSGDDFDSRIEPQSFKTKEDVSFKLWAQYFAAPDKERNRSLTTILEKEFIKLKGIYCFLDETQIMGKTLTKLGIPNICGKPNNHKGSGTCQWQARTSISSTTGTVVGGVLVMPHNDQLLQITRVSQTEWEQKSVLPVSFSTLQLPNTKSSLVLPEYEPITLQAVCRSCIRCTLRADAEKEHPQLTRQWQRKHIFPRKKRAIRNLIIPFLESSDEEESLLRGPRLLIGGNASRFTAVLDISSRSWPPRARYLRGGITRAAGTRAQPSENPLPSASSISAREVVEQIEAEALNAPTDFELPLEFTQRDNTAPPAPPAPLKKRVSSIFQMMASSPKTGSSSGSSPKTASTSERPNVPKREKFDSGVGDDIDNGKPLSSSDEENETHTRYHLSSDDEDTMDVDSDSDFVEPQKSEDEGVEEDLAPEPKKGSTTGSKRESEPEFTYSSVMHEKINSLPLPPMLKNYLNLYREL